MIELFLSTSFSKHVNYETGRVNPEFRRSVEDVLEALRKIGGFSVFCAIENEDWIISNKPPEVGVKSDLEMIDESDSLMALLQEEPSGGVQFEMGYARGKGKQVVAATPAEVELAYFNQGLANLSEVTHIVYEHPQMLAKQVQQILTKPA